MLEKLLGFLAVVAVALGIAVVYLHTRLRAEGEIVRAQAEAQFLRAQRDTILHIVARNDSLQREVGLVRAEKETEAARLRERIDVLENERAAAQLTVRSLRRREDLQDRLRRTFPEMAASDWGVTEVFNEEHGVGIEYLLVPLWFSETFLIDHQNAMAYQTQADTLRTLAAVLTEVTVLQDSVFTLERGSRTAFERGYDEAFTRYEALNQDYIALLREPRFSLGVPGGLTLLAATFGAGVLLGGAVR